MSEAFASLSALGQTSVSVTETRFDNGVRQIARLPASSSTIGENFLSVELAKDGYPAKKENILVLKKINARGITQELRQNFPGISMRINAALPSNSYGNYGMAHGTDASGNGCHYGWQMMDGGVTKAKLSNFFADKGRKRLSLRVRVCGPKLTPSSFQTLMNSLNLSVPVDALERRKHHQWRSVGQRVAVVGSEPVSGYVVEDYAPAIPTTNEPLIVQRKPTLSVTKPKNLKPLSQRAKSTFVSVPKATETAPVQVSSTGSKIATAKVEPSDYVLVPLAD